MMRFLSRGSTARSATLLKRLSMGFFVVAIAEAVGLWIASFWALSDLSQLNSELVEITRSLDATRELSQELGGLLLYSQQVPTSPSHTAAVRSSLSAVRDKLESCATSTCHGARSDPAEMVASIAPSFQRLSETFQTMALEEARPAQLAAWSSESLELIEETQAKISRMSSALRARVDRLRESSSQVPARAQRHFLLLVMAGIGLAWAAASFSASRLLQPLGRLLAAIRSVAAGDLTEKVEVEETGEIRELADSFNDMVRRLQVYRAELERANRTLEQRVRERTDQLKRSQEVLYRSEKLASVGLLTSGIAHEINNPLTSILMNIDLLREEEEEGSRRWKELQEISEDAERCKRIIDDLREFSRERVFSKNEVDLTELVRRTLRLSDVMIEKKKIAVHYEGDQGGSLIVRCDAGRIQQVFTNIIVNAVDALSPGGILRVRGIVQNGHAVVTFTDNGCGILPENLSRVFDPFFTTKPQGTGLGLSICYGIVAEHGGTIEIESQNSEDARPRGTTVTVSLPLAESVGGEKN